MTSRKAQITLSLLFAVLVALCVTWFRQYPPRSGLDASWMYGLAASYDLKLRFGSDILFTSGPYFNLLIGLYQPLLYWPTICFGIAVSIFYSVSVLRLMDRSKASHWLLAFLVPLIGMMPRESSYYILPMLALANIVKDVGSLKAKAIVYLVPAMFFLALGTLIKGSIASLNVYVFLLGLVYLAYERRLALLSLSALSFSASLILLWLCAGQNLLDIVPYVRYGIIMALSYVEGMASYVMVQMDLVFVLFNLYVLFVLWREVGLKSIQKLFFFLIVFPFLFVVFKAGFVRDDPIHIMNTLPTLMQFFLILPIVVAFRQGKVLLFSGVMVAFLVFVEASLIATYAWVPRHPAMVSVEGLRVAIDGRGALDEELALAKESIRESYPLPVLSGGSDIYNYRQSLLLASGNRWDPRPIFQGYNTYHPSLLMLNKAHLEDDTKAPTNVFFRVETIGVRHPALDDGVSWPVLLRLYRLEGEFRDHLVFRRLEGANPAQGDGLRLISASGHTLEESLTLPAGDYRAIFARFDFGHSLLGNVTQALFKVTPLFLDYELADGSSRSYAVYPVMVETGLIISPLLESNDDLMRLAMGEPPDPNKRILSVSVTPYGQALKASRLSKFVGWFWDKEFTMRLYAVEGIALPEGNPSGEPLAGDTGMPAIGP